MYKDISVKFTAVISVVYSNIIVILYIYRFVKNRKKRYGCPYCCKTFVSNVERIKHESYCVGPTLILRKFECVVSFRVIY